MGSSYINLKIKIWREQGKFYYSLQSNVKMTARTQLKVPRIIRHLCKKSGKHDIVLWKYNNVLTRLIVYFEQYLAASEVFA